MRRHLSALLASVLVAAGLMVIAASPAHADKICANTDPATGQCILWIDAPGTPGGGGGGQPVTCTANDGTVLPTCDGWDAEKQCYVTKVEPQPTTFEGRRIDPGSYVYNCTDLAGNSYPFLGGLCPVSICLAPIPPPTPEEVAQAAIATMSFHAINIGIVPKPGPGRYGLVGLPIWMWVDSPNATTWGPQTASACIRGVCVTAAAAVTKIDWTMGNNDIVTCTTKGVPYTDDQGTNMSPECGYKYTKPGRYDVTATATWTINWTGGGQTGTVTLSFVSNTQLEIREAQALNGR